MKRRRPGSELGAAWTELVMSRLRETGRCHVFGFGVFTITTRKPRRVRNPQTKELMTLPETVTVRFRAAGKLKKAATRAVRNAAQSPETGRQCESDTESEAGHG